MLGYIGLVQVDDHMADSCYEFSLGEAVLVRVESHIVNELSQNFICWNILAR